METLPVYINTGGASTTDLNSLAAPVTYDADRNFTGGVAARDTTANNIPGIAHTYRQGISFFYTFALPNGWYKITATFREPSFTSYGQRLLGVVANGVPALWDIDPWTGLVGGQVARSFLVSVTGGQPLVLSFAVSPGSQVNSAVVSAIEIQNSSSPTSAVPSPSGQTDKVLSNDGTTADWRALGGDISGAINAAVVAALRGYRVSTIAPIDGKILQYNGTAQEWAPADPQSLGNAVHIPNIYGGVDASSTITIAGTSNGAPSGAHVLLNPANEGSVGIGTTTPISKLHVNTGSATATYMTVGNLNNGILVGVSSGGIAQILAYTGQNIQIGAFNGGVPSPWVTMSSGSVGIGLSPSFKLDVGSSISVGIRCVTTDLSNATASLIVSSGHQWSLNALPSGAQASSFTIKDDSAALERFRIDNNGNVGIGTTTPVGPLHIQTPVANSTIIGAKENRIVLGITAIGIAGAGSEIVFENNDLNSARYAAIGTAIQGALTNQVIGDVYIATKANLADTTLTPRVYVQSGGNVGIGTVSPAVTLEISGAGSELLRLSGTSTNPYLSVVDHTGTISGFFQAASGSTTINIGSLSNHPVVFHIAGAEKMRLSTSGNVGIGTSNPQVPLDVNGTIRALNGGYVLTLSPNSTVNSELFCTNSAVYFGAASNVPLNLRTNDTDRLTIASGGNVGIGVSPSYKLDVYGAARFLYQTTTVNDPQVIAWGANNMVAYLGAYADANSGATVKYAFLQASECGVSNSRTLALNPLGGNVGIGTASPSAKLTIDAGGGSSPFNIVNNPSGGVVSIQDSSIETSRADGLYVMFNNSLKTINFQNSKVVFNGNGVVNIAGDLRLASTPINSDSAITRQYSVSKGQDLVTNGSGLMGNNYNFSGFTFSQNETHGGGGSFLWTGGAVALSTDELLPVDTSRTYRLSGWAKDGETGGANYAANVQYSGIGCFDIDGNGIDPLNFMKWPGSTDTTLAVTLNPGDTTMTVANATGWSNDPTGYSRGFIWYGYANSKGYTYPNYTYSRTCSYPLGSYGANGTWAVGGITGNVITLTQPWPGPQILAGVAVANNTSGGTYKYIGAAATSVPNVWTNYSGIIGGVDTVRNNSTNHFSPGTAFVKPVFLLNLDGVVTHIRWSDISFSKIENQGVGLASKFFDLTKGESVGIGVPVPAYSLDVAGDINFTGYLRSNGQLVMQSSGNYTVLFDPTGTARMFLGNNLDASNYYDNSNHIFRDRSAVEVMRINSGGKLGIGTDTPLSKLEVSGGTDASNYQLTVAHVSSGSQRAGINLKIDATNLWQMIADNTDGNKFKIGFQNLTSIPLAIDTSGNVGIGTTSPATSAILELASSTGALLVTRVTTTQKTALTAVNGMIVYDSTLDKLQCYQAGSWQNLI